MSTDSRTGTSSTIVTPSHKALRRLGRLGDESALDSECHLWELWIKILKTDPDTDHIRCPQCSPDHLDSECIWVDAAWGFRVQRIHLAKNILEVLKDITFPIPPPHLVNLRSAFQQSISLEEEINEIAGKVSRFRKVRGQGTVPTVWEILSNTFEKDLHAPRNAAAHELRSHNTITLHKVIEGDSDGQSGDKNDRIPETLTSTTTDANRQAHTDNLSPGGPVRCPYPGCDVTTNAGKMCLRRHFLCHTRNSGNFRCLRCPYVSATLRALRAHGKTSHQLSPKGTMMLEMITTSSRRLETAFREAKGLTSDNFPDTLWL